VSLNIQRRLLVFWVAASLAVWPAAAAKRKLPKPGFNLFSVEQDIEIGKAGAREIEKKVQLVTDPEINQYIQTIGRKLAATPYAGKFPYSFKVVQDDSINAFALPGGPTYVNTGLILAADNEAQLAGVMGHEIAHVALRHGTSQASKANFIQLAAMIGSGLLGGGSIASELARLGISFGASSVLLKYSRGAERSADILGAHIVHAAGYNPVEMARFFEKLQAETGERSKIATFFSTHPDPGNRMKRIEEEVQYMPPREYDAPTGRLSRIQARLRRLAGAAKPAESGPGSASEKSPSPSAPAAGAPPSLRRPAQLPAPSGRVRSYRGRAFAFEYPANWKLFDGGGSSVTVAPAGAAAGAPGQNLTVALGAILGHVADPRLRGADLAKATQLLIERLKAGNPSLRAVDRAPTQLTVDGRPALLTTLFTDSPYQGETEIDLLVTVQTSQGLFYAVFAAPQRDFRSFQPSFERILKSIDLVD